MPDTAIPIRVAVPTCFHEAMALAFVGETVGDGTAAEGGVGALPTVVVVVGAAPVDCPEEMEPSEGDCSSWLVLSTGGMVLARRGSSGITTDRCLFNTLPPLPAEEEDS